MEQHAIVSREQWLAARRELLDQEKELTRLRDQLAARRRALPWLRVADEYVFDGPSGSRTLAQLFDGKRQLLVYHLMFGPDAESPCRSCSFWADAFDPARIHLAQRDVTLVAISRAPLAKLRAFAERMGWEFPWYSSAGTTFNFDYGVSFPEGDSPYNYGSMRVKRGEMPGISAFLRTEDDQVFHTYSCYGRGIEVVNPTYQFLDLTAHGRDEAALSHPMAWVRYHDEY